MSQWAREHDDVETTHGAQKDLMRKVWASRLHYILFDHGLIGFSFSLQRKCRV